MVTPMLGNAVDNRRLKMKRLLIAAALAATMAPAFPATVSVSVGDPHFYGRLDIGGYPAPPVIYRQPMIVERVAADRPLVYLRVPPGHAKHWRQHCREYNACGERVMFVQDNWYSHDYAPRYREGHGGHQAERRAEPRDDHRAGPQDDHRGGQGNESRGDNRGHGRDR
jgi:hypothetical protein